MIIFTNASRPQYQTFPVPDPLPPNTRIATQQEQALIESGVPLKWDGNGNVVEKPQAEIDAEQLAEKRKGMVVSRFQARAALSNAGLLSQAETAIANATDPIVSLAWQDAMEFRRNSPTIQALAPELGLDDAALDQLFEDAAQIEA